MLFLAFICAVFHNFRLEQQSVYPGKVAPFILLVLHTGAILYLFYVYSFIRTVQVALQKLLTRPCLFGQYLSVRSMYQPQRSIHYARP